MVGTVSHAIDNRVVIPMLGKPTELTYGDKRQLRKVRGLVRRRISRHNNVDLYGVPPAELRKKPPVVVVYSAFLGWKGRADVYNPAPHLTRSARWSLRNASCR